MKIIKQGVQIEVYLHTAWLLQYFFRPLASFFFCFANRAKPKKRLPLPLVSCADLKKLGAAELALTHHTKRGSSRCT